MPFFLATILECCSGLVESYRCHYVKLLKLQLFCILFSTHIQTGATSCSPAVVLQIPHEAKWHSTDPILSSGLSHRHPYYCVRIDKFMIDLWERTYPSSRFSSLAVGIYLISAGRGAVFQSRQQERILVGYETCESD